VDSMTESLIQDALRTLLHGRTAVVIAHRLSTIRGADLICVVQDGRIVEQGKHEELLARAGAYAALYQRQFAE
jgi:ABC-type multidrug transport system fused ATPase/permease subunit